MEFESFFGALTMERKASLALSEGKLLLNSLRISPGLVERLAGLLAKLFGKFREIKTAKRESCITCFAGIPKSGCVLPASQSKVGGVQMLQKPRFQMLWRSKTCSSLKDSLPSTFFFFFIMPQVLTLYLFGRRRRQTGELECCLKFTVS